MSRDQVIYINNNPVLNEKFDAYRQELERNNLVSSVSATAVNPFNVGQVIDINWVGNSTGKMIPIRYTMVDYDYFKTMGMKVIEGRSFSDSCIERNRRIVVLKPKPVISVIMFKRKSPHYCCQS